MGMLILSLLIMLPKSLLPFCISLAAVWVPVAYVLVVEAVAPDAADVAVGSA